MRELIFAQGKLAARASNPISRNSTILLGILGGPGLSGHYMDSYISAVCKVLKIDFVVLDLPNHRPLDRAKIESYAQAKNILLSFLAELAELKIRAHVIGYSLGAVIALDLLLSKKMDFKKSILISMPAELKPNPAFTKSCDSAGVTKETLKQESDFEKWWRKVLPAYFYGLPSTHHFELLATNTSWLRNSGFTTGLPSAQSLVQNAASSFFERIRYFEGTKELPLPESNFARIQALFPGVPATRLPACGHFPMLEREKDLIQATIQHLKG